MRPRLGLSITLIALALGAVPESGVSNPSQVDLDRTVTELNQLHQWLGDAAVRLEVLQTKLHAADESIASLVTTTKRTSTNLTNTTAAIEILERQRTRLEGRRELQAKKIAVHLRQAYKLSGQDFLKLLLLQENPDTFDRLIRYHGYFSRARKEALQEYRSTLTSMENTTTELATRGAEYERQEEDLRKRSKRLQEERLARQEIISNLAQEIKDKGSVRDLSLIHI